MTSTSRTLQFSEDTLFLQTDEAELIGSHNAELWFALESQPLVESNKVTLQIEINKPQLFPIVIMPKPASTY